MIKHVKTKEEFINETKNGTVLVDYFATWCGPCKMLAEVIEELDSLNINDLTIVKVDVDVLSDVAVEHKINAVPTLELYSDGTLVKTAMGYCNINELKKFITK